MVRGKEGDRPEVVLAGMETNGGDLLKPGQLFDSGGDGPRYLSTSRSDG